MEGKNLSIWIGEFGINHNIQLSKAENINK